MKTQLLTVAAAFALSGAAVAANTTKTTDKVTAFVQLDEDIDFVITGTTPFSDAGTVDITNTEHAVVILQNLQPSEALGQLSYIKINGEPAVDGENCQVKMYAQGAIILPYGKDFKPLTVYSEPDFGGEAVDNFGLENSGGYMNTLSPAKLNNRIRSFKLKRGYMVTFANNPGGRGYSRCFIADKADLEIKSLPRELDRKISSYRVFKWHNFQKKGIASTGDEATVKALKVTWCYDWGQGNASREPDCEWVPHHIYEDWPSVATCGGVTQSCHMQTNNEPGNSADDNPQSVDVVLNNWENLMATGMRLCSPSSHDGSLNWLHNFLDSIDARGWRCDILDMHCYWDEWQLNNSLKSWFDRHHRPIWVSEFVYGASWNNNGIFATDRTFSQENQQKNYDVMHKVLENWNSWSYVERYAYWNGEADCSKLYKDGQLSILGKWYADSHSSLGYNKTNEYVPKVVYGGPSGLAVEYTERTRKLVLTWNYNRNMGFTDSTLVEVRLNDGEWQTLKKIEGPDQTSYTYNETFGEDFQRGVYTYRVSNYDADGKVRQTNEAQLSLVSAEGEPGFQYGTLKISDTEESNTEFDALEADEEPAVFTGLVSYNNPTVVPVNTVVTVLSNKFTFWAFPWNQGDFGQTVTEPETTDFMVLRKGTRQIGDITMEVGESESRIKNDTTRISFAKPFPEGVTPVVIANVQSRYKNYPYMVKIWDITNEGFAVKLARQAGVNPETAFAGQVVFYVAATPGTAGMDNEKVLTVGRNTEDKVDGRRTRTVNFVNETGEPIGLFNPVMLLGPQTNNYDVASVYRIGRYDTDADNVDTHGTPAATGARIIRQKDTTDEAKDKGTDNVTSTGDIMGWIAVSTPKEEGETGIKAATAASTFKAYVRDGRIIVLGVDDYRIYDIGGRQVSRAARLPRGIYMVKAGDRSAKVMVP